MSAIYPKENKFDISAKAVQKNILLEAPYYGVFVENINFEKHMLTEQKPTIRTISQKMTAIDRKFNVKV